MQHFHYNLQLTINQLVTLHAKLSGAVYYNWSCLWVCVCLWLCYHDNSKFCVHRSSPNWVCR